MKTIQQICKEDVKLHTSKLQKYLNEKDAQIQNRNNNIGNQIYKSLKSCGICHYDIVMKEDWNTVIKFGIC